MNINSNGMQKNFTGWVFKLYNNTFDTSTFNSFPYDRPGALIGQYNASLLNYPLPNVTTPVLNLAPYNITLSAGRYWISVFPIINGNTNIAWGPITRNTTANGLIGKPLCYIEYFPYLFPNASDWGIWWPENIWTNPTSQLQDISFSIGGSTYLDDTSAPTLNRITLSPQIIDLNNANRDLTILANFTDVSGIASASVVLTSPITNTNITLALSPVVGTTWGVIYTFPQSAEAGTWRVISLTVTDGAGPSGFQNTATWNQLQLTLLGNDIDMVVIAVSASPSPSPSSSTTPSTTPSRTPSINSSPSTSSSSSPSRSPSATASINSTPSSTPSVSTTPSVSVTPSASASTSVSPSRSPSTAASPSATASPQPGTSCPPCTSNADCSSGRGVCVAGPIGSYCSCLSGFGGCDCSSLPSSFCNTSYSQVNTLSGNFQANTSIDYVYPRLLVTVDANSEESVYGNGGLTPTNTPPYSLDTLVFFGPSATDFPSCSYPNGGYTWNDLSAQPGRCYDKYISNMTWTFAKDNCGFEATNGSRNYTQTVTIQRKYNLNGVIQRTEQTTRSLYIMYVILISIANANNRFPEEISVTDSNVTVSFPSADAFAAITFIDFDPSTQLWTVVVQTSIANPYYLESPYLAYLTGSLAQRTPSVSITPCTTVDNYCVQTATYIYPQGSASDACLGLVGQDRHTYPVSCNSSTCPEPSPINVTLQLNTGNACPATDYIDFSQTSLTSYSDPSLSSPSNSFTINDDAYFGATVQTTEALISSRSIKPNSVCFQPPSGPCFYVAYTVLSPTAGKDPVFVVDLNGPGNSPYFNNITSPTQFSVSATVEVNFVGAKGLLNNVPQSQTVQTISQAMIEPASEPAMSSSSVLSPLVALLLCVLMI